MACGKKKHTAGFVMLSELFPHTARRLLRREQDTLFSVLVAPLWKGKFLPNHARTDCGLTGW